MNRSILAGATLALGIAIALPIAAWPADAPPPAGQPAPIIPPMGQAPMHGAGMAGGAGMMGGMAGHLGMGPMGRPGMGPMGRMGWRHRMMMRGMMRMSPQQRCNERIARRAGMIAYTIAKLNLTPPQRPLWDKVQGALQQAADKQRQWCATLKPREERRNETVLDRLNRREQLLSNRLEALQQVTPALQQFYQALTADQKAIIDHPFRPG
jgi:LTXXQ motif family protein